MAAFEDELFAYVDESPALKTYFEQQAACFAGQINQLENARNCKVLDASGKSCGLVMALSLSGYDMRSLCTPAHIPPMPAVFSTRLRSHIVWNAGGQDEQVDVVIAAHDVLSESLTEATLAAKIDSFARALLPGGMLLINTRNYDRLLQSKPRGEETQIFTTQQGRCIRLGVWQWSGYDCSYTANHYLLRHTGKSCDLVHQQSRHTAWRRAEINLLLSAAGFSDIQWQPLSSSAVLAGPDEMLVRARKNA